MGRFESGYEHLRVKPALDLARIGAF